MEPSPQDWEDANYTIDNDPKLQKSEADCRHEMIIMCILGLIILISIIYGLSKG